MRARAAAILFLPTLLLAQVAQKTPRMPDGKPVLTGVYQGNATVRGTWEQANSGVGVGGTGRDTTAPAPPSASARPPVREPAPYQPWAAKKVLASFNNRGIDDPHHIVFTARHPSRHQRRIVSHPDHPDSAASGDSL